ncbi:phenylalanine--tRNA ligase subunit beta [Mycoplasmopsis iners]|uniref:phenylalanine--tRNA ligase subunit beta n=1 Tax=Mycoplasmopsis iners TaxID=76630 RepID=UPI000494FB67|nr:phenylalanine--tRNA ligase subunit beta [Mycoplasmopsis iners]
MLISLKQLNKFLPNIKLDTTVEKAINNLGYEVESIKPFTKAKGIKFAKVLDVYKNPNSQTLNVVKLLTNTGEITIQTVAQNAKKGYFTVAFVEGAQLGDITFAAKKMGGIVSQGMLSGFPELGFDITKLPYSEDDLVMIKGGKFNLDTDPIEYFELDDYIIDITTPSNRADINSYYVLALELAAYYNTEFKWFNWNRKLDADFRSKIKVNKNEANALAFLEVKVKNNETKLEDQLFLAKHNIEAKGIWAIDITNVNLLLTGAPTHAYDSNKIGHNITCEYYSGKVEILGKKEVVLNNALVIKDENSPISLASVMGLEATSVNKKSNEIAFEIGSFDNKAVRLTAKQIKLDSNSSIQGSRGINKEMVRMGMKYLVYKAHDDKQRISQFINLPKASKQVNIIQNRHKLATYANMDVKELNQFSSVETQLRQIGFSIDKNRIVAPAYRSDIANYEDIIEEYFRFYGYDNFKPVAPILTNPTVLKTKNIKNNLKAMGYQEIRTFSLISKEKNIFNPFDFEENIELDTFVSLEREVVRNSLIASLLEVAEYNIKRKMNKFSFFESGMINLNQYVYGLMSNAKSFDEMKANIANILNTDNLSFVPFKDNKFIHPNVSAKIYQNNNFIGWIGKINPAYDKTGVIIAEFKALEKEASKTLFKEYINEPLKNIDLTFALDPHVSIKDKIDEIKQVANVFSIEWLDEFEKENKNNVTLRITAEAEEINNLNNKYNK